MSIIVRSRRHHLPHDHEQDTFEDALVFAWLVHDSGDSWVESLQVNGKVVTDANWLDSFYTACARAFDRDRGGLQQVFARFAAELAARVQPGTP
jgi:hypothetical protein